MQPSKSTSSSEQKVSEQKRVSPLSSHSGSAGFEKAELDEPSVPAAPFDAAVGDDEEPNDTRLPAQTHFLSVLFVLIIVIAVIGTIDFFILRSISPPYAENFNAIMMVAFLFDSVLFQQFYLFVLWIYRFVNSDEYDAMFSELHSYDGELREFF